MRPMHKHQPTKPPRMKRFDLGKKDEPIVYPDFKTSLDNGVIRVLGFGTSKPAISLREPTNYVKELHDKVRKHMDETCEDLPDSKVFDLGNWTFEVGE
jgi:hypothetical protein